MADSSSPCTPRAVDDTSSASASSSPTSVASVPTVASTEATRHDPSWRARRRLSERKSRAKRKDNFERMHAQIEVLERAVANMPYVFVTSETETGTDDDDDYHDRAMRDFLRRSMALEREKEELRDQNQALAAMVAHREQATRALRLLTRGMRVDAWSQQTEGWRETTLATFVNWTHEACLDVIHDSMKKIKAFSFDGDDSESTGMSFLGWRDRRRLDVANATIHFSFTKTYRNMDAEAMARGYWDMHLDSAKYARCMLGPNVKCYYEVIQHVSPDICIVRCVEQYPTVPVKIHMLFMIFRVRTRDGFVQCLRSLPCPEIQRATLDDDAFWTTNFHWVQWDITARDAKGNCAAVRSSVNGSIASSTVDYANRWMGEAILTLVRAESILLGRALLAR